MEAVCGKQQPVNPIRVNSNAFSLVNQVYVKRPIRPFYTIYKSLGMKIFEGFVSVLVLLLNIFSATIIVLVRYNVILDPIKCCELGTSCSEILNEQHDAYYNQVTGLRTRYILAVVLFFFTFLLRCTSVPYYLGISVPKFILDAAGLVSYTTYLLFADSTIRSFSSSPDILLPVCADVSEILTRAVSVLAWMLICLAILLYYTFTVTSADPKSKQPRLLSHVVKQNVHFSVNDGADPYESEEEVFTAL